MNENAPLRIAFLSDDSRLRANWRAVHAFNRVTSNEINKKMKTSNRIHQPLAIALRFFYNDNCALLVCAFAAAQSTMPKRVWRRWKHSTGS